MGGVYIKKIKQIQDKLKDKRSGKVLYVSHCLLNMNARYFGGAFRSSIVTEIIQGAIERDIAVIQMKCPEQQIWGGILKPMMWTAFESKQSILYKMRTIFVPIFLFYTRMRYRWLANTIVKEICDYENAGYKVVGVVGIDGSPTCGINCSINIKKAFELYALATIEDLNREDFNQNLYSKCLSDSDGIFFNEMKKELVKKGRKVSFFSHSLLEEMDGKYDSVWEVIK